MNRRLSMMKFLIILSILLIPVVGSNYQIPHEFQKTSELPDELVHTTAWIPNGVKVPDALVLGPSASTTIKCPQAALCSDGAGGANIVWLDFTYSGITITQMAIWARRVDSSGTFQWNNPNGVNVFTFADYTAIGIGFDLSPKISSDGAGGALITWIDYVLSTLTIKIYAQRLNNIGSKLWGYNGIEVCKRSIINPYSATYGPQICSDGAGGAIVTWNDHRGSDYDIYAQRINSVGVPQWGANGTTICTTAGDQTNAMICSDGTGGAIITWLDERGSDTDIYAQKVNSAGTPQWAANGVGICTNGTIPKQYPRICSDDAGGAIITWRDKRTDNGDIYAQRINSGGTVQWDANGVGVCLAPKIQKDPQICSDKTHGCIITWHDNRNASDIYAQRINSNGKSRWISNGVVVCNALNDQIKPQIAPANSQGAVITWNDSRSVTHSDIYAQLIDSTGQGKWGANGTVICMAIGNQGHPQICNTGSGNGIIIWEDNRDSSYMNVFSDIYAQLVTIPPNTPPNKPSNPSPANGSSDASSNPTLSVIVSDPNSDIMNVSFYNAPNNTLIGTVTDVPSGGTASVNWTGQVENVTYQWYAVADDWITTNQSETWSFTITTGGIPGFNFFLCTLGIISVLPLILIKKRKEISL